MLSRRQACGRLELGSRLTVCAAAVNDIDRINDRINGRINDRIIDRINDIHTKRAWVWVGKYSTAGKILKMDGSWF